MDHIEDAASRVDRDFRRRYGRGLEDYEITDAPGYWQRKEQCGGLGVCSSGASHSAWGWEKGFRHTAQYRDSTRDPRSGRIASPYRTWRTLHAAQCVTST